MAPHGGLPWLQTLALQLVAVASRFFETDSALESRINRLVTEVLQDLVAYFAHRLEHARGDHVRLHAKFMDRRKAFHVGGPRYRFALGVATKGWTTAAKSYCI